MDLFVGKTNLPADGPARPLGGSEAVDHPFHALQEAVPEVDDHGGPQHLQMAGDGREFIVGRRSFRARFGGTAGGGDLVRHRRR